MMMDSKAKSSIFVNLLVLQANHSVVGLQLKQAASNGKENSFFGRQTQPSYSRDGGRRTLNDVPSHVQNLSQRIGSMSLQGSDRRPDRMGMQKLSPGKAMPGYDQTQAARYSHQAQTNIQSIFRRKKSQRDLLKLAQMQKPTQAQQKRPVNLPLVQKSAKIVQSIFRRKKSQKDLLKLQMQKPTQAQQQRPITRPLDQNTAITLYTTNAYSAMNNLLRQYLKRATANDSNQPLNEINFSESVDFEYMRNQSRFPDGKFNALNGVQVRIFDDFIRSNKLSRRGASVTKRELFGMIESMMRGLRKLPPIKGAKRSVLARAGTVHKKVWGSFAKKLQTQQDKKYPIHMLFDTVMSSAHVSTGVQLKNGNGRSYKDFPDQVSEVKRLYNNKVQDDEYHVKVIYMILPLGSKNSRGRPLGKLAVAQKQEEVLFLPGQQFDLIGYTSERGQTYLNDHVPNQGKKVDYMKTRGQKMYNAARELKQNIIFLSEHSREVDYKNKQQTEPVNLYTADLKRNYRNFFQCVDQIGR